MFGIGRKHLIQIVGLGAIAGMRSMSAPALAAAYLREHQPADTHTFFRWLATPTVSNLLKVLAAGELAGDKLPEIPARIEPGPLLGRAVFGALSGAAVSHVHGEREDSGAALAAVAAVASAFGAFYLRKYVVDTFQVPDPLVALVEDTIVLVGGQRLLRLDVF